MESEILVTALTHEELRTLLHNLIASNDFKLDQAPQFLREVIAYTGFCMAAAASAMAVAGVTIIGIVVSGVLNSPDRNNTPTGKQVAAIVGMIVSILILLVGLVGSLNMATDYFRSASAPRSFLVEYLDRQVRRAAERQQQAASRTPHVCPTSPTFNLEAKTK